MATLLGNAVATAAQAAHSAAVSVASAAQIKPGAKLPTASVKENDPEKGITLSNLPGKIVVLGVPGAFTPPCSSQVPGYIELHDQFTAKGVTGIYVIAINDAFVTKAWKEKLASGGTPVHFIADDQGAFTSAAGLVFDATGLLGGPRAKRYAIIANNGIVEKVFLEEDPTQVTSTKADAILAQL